MAGYGYIPCSLSFVSTLHPPSSFLVPPPYSLFSYTLLLPQTMGTNNELHITSPGSYVPYDTLYTLHSTLYTPPITL